MNEDEKSTYDELIYKTPSMEIVDKINSSNKDKIILTGVKKSGKTTTLKCLSNRSYNNSNMIIYIDYSNLSYISNLSSVEYGYYYELLFAKKILDFVKENYKDCYINLVFDDKYIQNEFERFQSYLECRINPSNNLSYQKGMFISKINQILKQIVGINSITLIIDHFDFFGCSSKKFQNYMIEFFDMFDKVVITSNDKNLSKEKLEEKGYELIKVDYSKNIKNIRNILTSHFNHWFGQINYNGNKTNVITKINYLINNDEFCYLLIEKTNGNIDMMINTLKISFIQNCTIEEAIEQVLKIEKEIESITFRRILYL